MMSQGVVQAVEHATKFEVYSKVQLTFTNIISGWVPWSREKKLIETSA
jgi:phage baseplate assembly protein gpV